MVTQTTSEKVSGMYQELKTFDSEIFDQSVGEIQAAMKRENIDLGGQTPEDAAMAFKVYGRMAHSCTSSEFSEGVENGEWPPVELSAEELEALRGGVATTIAVGVVVAICTVYSTFY